MFKSRGGCCLTRMLGCLAFLILFSVGLFYLGGQVFPSQAERLISEVQSKLPALDLEEVSLPAASPDTIATLLNQNAARIVSESQGMLDSATATNTDSSVTYTLVSSKVNAATANILYATSSNQLQELADEALDSMEEAGVANPEVTIQLVDDKGQLLKSQTYTR